MASFEGGGSPAESISAAPPSGEHAKEQISNAESSATPIIYTIEEGLDIPPTKEYVKKRRGFRKNPTINRLSQSWEAQSRSPYHEYVHKLVLAGWDNLQRLEAYMETDVQNVNLVISVVDIKRNYEVDIATDIL